MTTGRGSGGEKLPAPGGNFSGRRAVLNGMETNFADSWRAHRIHLVDLAFRMLGDIGAAEDVVQEAFTRLALADDIDDERAWLTVVTGRLCLDQLRSARVRREKSTDPGDFAATPASPGFDPADRVTLDQEVQLAMLVVLQRLGPAERVAFILHDVFALPFDMIAETLGRPVGTCRQLARRARHKIADAGTDPEPVVAQEHRAITERFIDACAGGDIGTLVAVLHPDAWGRAEFVGPTAIEPVLSHGRAEVVANLVSYYGPEVTLVSHPACDRPAVLAYLDRRLFAVLVLTVENGLIRRLDATVDPPVDL